MIMMLPIRADVESTFTWVLEIKTHLRPVAMNLDPNWLDCMSFSPQLDPDLDSATRNWVFCHDL